MAEKCQRYLFQKPSDRTSKGTANRCFLNDFPDPTLPGTSLGQAWVKKLNEALNCLDIPLTNISETAALIVGSANFFKRLVKLARHLALARI